MVSDIRSGKLALVVGGGPAPGINGVISSVTIEAIEQGLEVIGFRDGFRHLVDGSASRAVPSWRAVPVTPVGMAQAVWAETNVR